MNWRWLTRSLVWCDLFHSPRWLVRVPETYNTNGTSYCPICKREREITCFFDRNL